MHVWKPEDLQGLVLSYRGNLGCELRLVDLSLSATELTLCNLYGTMTIRIERTANITKTLLYFALAPPIRLTERTGILTERTGILTHKASHRVRPCWVKVSEQQHAQDVKHFPLMGLKFV